MTNHITTPVKNKDLNSRFEDSPNPIQTTNQIVGVRRWWALSAVLLTMFFSAMAQTVVSTAMPVIIGELEGFSLYAWIFTAYMITSAVTVPIYGKLSDVYGRKPFYVWGLILFMIGSVASGLVANMPQLILARALQGLGAGALLSMPRATVGDIFNPRERGRWMGVIASVFGVASIIGPVLGGWITDHWGWRWIFYINLPVGVLALIAVLYTLPKVKTEDQVKIDWWGSLLLVAGLVPLLLAFTWAGTAYAWLSPTILGLFAGSILILGLFIWVERQTDAPIIAPQLFANSIFTSTTIVALLVSMAMFGVIVFLPLFIQGVLEQTAQQSGQILMAFMLSFIVGSITGGQLITRTGRYKWQAVGGTLLMATGTFLLTQMGQATSPFTIVVNIALIGIGIGFVLPLLNVAVQNVFPYKMMGMVSATQQFVRSIGGVIAVSVLGTVLITVFTSQLAQQIPAQVQTAINQLPPAQRETLSNPQGLINVETQKAIQANFAAFGDQSDVLYRQFIEAVQQSLVAATTRLFMLSLGFAVLAFLTTFILKEVPLQQDEFFVNPSNEPLKDVKLFEAESASTSKQPVPSVSD